MRCVKRLDLGGEGLVADERGNTQPQTRERTRRELLDRLVPSRGEVGPHFGTRVRSPRQEAEHDGGILVPELTEALLGRVERAVIIVEIAQSPEVALLLLGIAGAVIALEKRLVVAGSILAGDHTQDRSSEVAVHLVGLETRGRFASNGLVTYDGTERRDHDGPELRREFTLALARVPAETFEVGPEQGADLGDECRSLIGAERAVDEVDGRRDARPGRWLV